MSDTYPEKLEIIPLTNVPRTMVSVPGSKSITNRALVLAAQLWDDTTSCRIHGALNSEDTQVMLESLRRLGFQIDKSGDTSISVSRPNSSELIPNTSADLFVANSGTTMRFLTAFVCLGNGRYRLDGTPRMRERPIEDLLVALRQLGVNAQSELGNGCPPVIVDAGRMVGGRARVKGDVSSQFLSALLLVAPSAWNEVVIEVEGS